MACRCCSSAGVCARARSSYRVCIPPRSRSVCRSSVCVPPCRASDSVCTLKERGSTHGPCVCDYAVYTMRLVQTALRAAPAVNHPRHRTEYRHRLLFPNRSVLCCLSLASCSHQVVVSSRTPPPLHTHMQTHTRRGWGRSKLTWSFE